MLNIYAKCEIGDKHDSLILHKYLIIKQQQVYKLTVISKWNDSNIIYSVKTLKEF